MRLLPALPPYPFQPGSPQKPLTPQLQPPTCPHTLPRAHLMVPHLLHQLPIPFSSTVSKLAHTPPTITPICTPPCPWPYPEDMAAGAGWGHLTGKSQGTALYKAHKAQPSSMSPSQTQGPYWPSPVQDTVPLPPLNFRPFPSPTAHRAGCVCPPPKDS